MKTGVGSANDNEPPCAFQGVNARSQSPGPRQESEGGFLELLGARTTLTCRSQCPERVPNQGAAAPLQMPAAPMGTGEIYHTALIPGAGQIFHPLLENGIFAKAEILMSKNQTKHLIFLPLNFWEDFHGRKSGEPFRSKHFSVIKSK